MGCIDQLPGCIHGLIVSTLSVTDRVELFPGKCPTSEVRGLAHLACLAHCTLTATALMPSLCV